MVPARLPPSAACLRSLHSALVWDFPTRQRSSRRFSALFFVEMLARGVLPPGSQFGATFVSRFTTEAEIRDHTIERPGRRSVREGVIGECEWFHRRPLLAHAGAVILPCRLRTSPRCPSWSGVGGGSFSRDLGDRRVLSACCSRSLLEQMNARRGPPYAGDSGRAGMASNRSGEEREAFFWAASQDFQVEKEICLPSRAIDDLDLRRPVSEKYEIVSIHPSILDFSALALCCNTCLHTPDRESDDCDAFHGCLMRLITRC